MFTRLSRTAAVALLVVAGCFGAWNVSADPAAAPAPTLSTAIDQYAAGEDGGITMLQQGAYVVGATVSERVGGLLPAALGLDAIDLEPDGGVLFSTESDGLVHHTGGTIRLSQDRVYRLLPDSGAIEPVSDWGAHGVEIGSLDALDRLADGGIAFSTAHYRFVVHGGGASTLRPQNVYRFDPLSGAIDLLVDGDAMGLSNLDAFHAVGPAVFMFSTASDRFIELASGGLDLRHQDVYLVDGDSVAPWFVGAGAGIQSLDALSVPGARASNGLLLIPRDPQATLSEQDPTALVEYFVSLTRRPDRSTTIDLASPDFQLGCSPDRIGFTPYDWLLPWTIRVNAIDDEFTETPRHRGTMTHTAVAGDPRWTGAELPSMRFEILDNDTRHDDAPRTMVAPADDRLDLDRDRDEARPQARRPLHGGARTRLGTPRGDRDR